MKHIYILITLIFSNMLIAQIPFYNVNTQKFGVIDEKGNILSEALYNNEIEFKNGYSPINLDGKYGLINDKGEVIITPEYQGMGGTYNEGYINAKKDGQWGYIDSNNNVVIDFQFDWCGTFCDEITWIKQGNVYGFIDNKGEELTPIWYEKILGIMDGKGYAKKGDKTYEISTEGIKVLENIEIDYGSMYECYKTGIKAKNIHHLEPFQSPENKRWGYKNKDGKIVIEPKYKRAIYFLGDYAYVEMDITYGGQTFGRPAVIDFNGNVIIEPKVEYKGIIRIYGKTFMIQTVDNENPSNPKFIFKNNRGETIFE